LLRNFIHNTSSNVGPICINLNHYSVYYNIIGNVLGSPEGQSSAYESETSGPQSLIYRLGFPNIGNFAWGGSSNTEGESNPKYDGRHTIGPTNPPDYRASPNTRANAQALDLNVKNTVIRHGNYDYGNKTGVTFDRGGGHPKKPGIVWETDDSRGTGVDFADHSIPNSYYLKKKPSWWPASTPWPPIGSDKQPMVSELPAETRFKALKRSASNPVRLKVGSPSSSTGR
jgi:hypothetical protein